MNQQINLYQPELFDKRVPFAFRRMVAVLFGVLALLLVFGTVDWWRLGRLETQLEQARARQDAALQRIRDFQLQYPPRSTDPVLARTVERLTGERQALLVLLQSLASGQPGNNRGFSVYLAGLARQRLPSVWLRRIYLAAGGERLLLEGSTTRAADVPLYLQGLTDHEVFAGREFEHLQLSRSAKAPQVVDFLLQTTPEEEP